MMVGKGCSFLSDESGATAIEYALIASLIFLAAFGGMSATGTSVSELYRGVFERIAAAVSGPP
jgi:pilus assembly protein Flp/PilA